ncbi:hypothetical protein [Streptomyces sp. IBSBF 2435]|uniref:hypothetical protein n=1 Tax=Streptomyces sp. IBSBF 2435 TaxID=2903531 RepID=UPI002FDC12D9
MFTRSGHAHSASAPLSLLMRYGGRSSSFSCQTGILSLSRRRLRAIDGTRKLARGPRPATACAAARRGRRPALATQLEIWDCNGGANQCLALPAG